ncbi:hypothetical protein PFISCL1PPCAC_23658 [Pristionchus fissidentatus]|uniref:Putative neurobeachin homolog n=1 Tax=Pristionchus fissidentatus TaxID=1538716 RepID=A0AAV5WN08_9BILA|nr:hypothetical protein PFISCL1PPCAC_23658 [Pristionchus fissidentatus]
MDAFDEEMEIPHTFHAFHPALLRTLESFIAKDLHYTQVELGSLLAILARLPLTSSSSDHFDRIQSALHSLLNQIEWTEVLSCDCSSPFSELPLLIDEGSLPKGSTDNGTRRVGRWNLRDSAEGESDFEDSGPTKRKRRIVNVSECVLLSDSDGFAAHLGDFPPPGDEVEKEELDSSTIYYMYKNLFGAFPTFFSSIDSALNVVILSSTISQFSGYSKHITVLSELINRMRPPIEPPMSNVIHTVRSWLNLLRIYRQISYSVLAISTISQDNISIVELGTKIAEGLVRDAVRISQQLCLIASSTDFDSTPLGVIRSMEASNHTVVFLIDHNLALIELQEKRRDLLTTIGESIIAWMDSSMDGSEWIDGVFLSIDNRLGRRLKGDPLEQRFLFETTAALLESSNDGIVRSSLHFLLQWPHPLSPSIGGSELLFVLLPHLTSDNEKRSREAMQILNSQLPRLEWNGKGMESTDSLPTDGRIYASRAANKLAVIWRTTENLSTAHLYSLFKYLSPIDGETVMVEGVVPRIINLCEDLARKEEIPTSPTISAPGELSQEDRLLLKTLEIIAFELKTSEAATVVARKILRPFCDLLAGVVHLRDVFFGITLRVCRLALPEFTECGMMDWLLNQLEICRRSAAADIWTIVEDSAILFYRPFIASLTLLEDILEQSADTVSVHSARILSLMSSIVDMCFGWLRLPSPLYGNIYRISCLMVTALSSYLILSSETNVMKRFSDGFLKAIGSPPSSPLLLSIALPMMIETSVSRRVSSHLSRLSIDCETDDAPTENEQGGGDQGPSYGRMAILHPELIVTTLTMLNRVIEISDGADPKIQRAIEKVCMQLKVVERESDEEKEWMDPLCSICSSLLSRHFPSHLLVLPLTCLSRLLLRERNPLFLATFIRFFHHENADDTVKYTILDRLRWMLSREKDSPSEYLVFPQVGVTNEKFESSSFSLPSSPTKGKTKTASAGRTIFKRLLRSINSTETTPTHEGIDAAEMIKNEAYSVGAAASLRLSGRSEMKGSDGVTVSTWIKTIPTPACDRLNDLHVLSIGGDSLCVTLTINTKRGQMWLTTRVADIQIKKERVRGASVRSGRWQHIVFGLRVSTTTARTTVAVDSRVFHQETTLLVKLEKSSFPLSIQLGSMSRRIAPHYFLSNIFSFQGLLSQSQIIVLSSLGSDLSSLAETKLPHLCPSFSSIVSYRLVSRSSQVPLRSAISDTERIITRLQRQLVLCIRVSSASSFEVSELPPDLDPAYLTQENALTMAFLNDKPIQWKTRLVRSSVPSLHSAFASIGSLKLLLFLMAKSINDSLCASTQRAALRVALTAAALQPIEAKANKFDKVICTLLSSSLARVDREMTEVLLDHCISRENEGEERGEEEEGDRDSPPPFIPSFLRDQRSNDVIRDPKLLVSLVSSVDLWTKREDSWMLIISRMASLVDEKRNSCFEFNRFQLNDSSALNRLIHMVLKQMSVSDASMTSSTLVDDLLLLLHSLIGTPEKLEGVVQLWYLIFLSHPASSSFIDQRIDGHCGWLNSDILREKSETELVGDSQLGKRLKKYVSILGRDAMESGWSSGLSLFEMRKEYEEIVGVSSDEEKGAGDGTRRGGRGLPDLISDIVGSEESRETSSEETRRRADSKEGGEHPEWVVRLRAGALHVFSDILQNGSDALLQCLLHDVVSWQAILVLLTKQSDIRIREAVLCTLEKFLLRANLFTKMTFIQLSGFEMLSSQLKGGPVSASIADSLFGILCGETIRLGDGLDETRLSQMSVDRLSCGSIHPIFVLFSHSVNDLALFWNVSNALLKIYEVNSQLQAAMAESSLAEVMVNVLLKVAELPLSESEVLTSSPSSPSVQLECWMSFAQRIVVSSYPYMDDRVNKMCDRFLVLLQLADWYSCSLVSSLSSPLSPPPSSSSLSSSLRAHSIVRSQLSQLLHCCIESIRTVFSDEGRSASNSSSIDSIPSLSSSPSDDYDMCNDMFIPPEKALLLDGTSPFSAFVAGSFANLREKLSSMGPISRRSLRCHYRRRRGAAPLAPLDALLTRVLTALDTALNLFAAHPQAGVATEEESNLFHFCLYLMLTSWGRTEGRQSLSASRSESIWAKIIVSCKERVRVVLAQLVAFVLFPAQTKLAANMGREGASWLHLPIDREWAEERRRQLVRALSHELQYKRNLAQLLSVNLDYEYALCLGIYELALLSRPLSEDCKGDVERMIDFLRSTNVGSPMHKLTPDSLANLTTDEILSMHSYLEYRKAILATLRSTTETIKDEEAKRCSELEGHAMSATCEIVEQLSTPRRMNLLMTKDCLLDTVEAEAILEAITKEVCHPAGVGFDGRSWPAGQSLERRESVNREKRRLRPASYPFEKRFFREERREEIRQSVNSHPLEKILKKDASSPSSSSLHHRRLIGEGVQLYLDATLLCATFECAGELLVAEAEISFSGDRARSTQKGVECPAFSASWKYSSMTEIHNRNNLLKDVALEVFLESGETILIVFSSSEKRSQLRNYLESKKLGHLFTQNDHVLQTFTSTWRHGGTTNFDYLMQLNKLAGRSFNDLMQYPVFPFVLADYTSAVLDLSKPSSFRSFSRPMAVQDRSMEEHYASNYRCLEESSRDDRGFGTPLHFGPYHYGSHYSNCGIVVHYLVRISPFTQIALEYQDNNFDIPDRLFNSIEATWRLASRDSTTDFKELIPEFFFLPEFLQNRDKLELGTRQGGERVGDVKLPHWTPPNNPRLFILIHRQALESSYVTNHIHQWIDLIFGYKQQGPAALRALNVFHPATYLGHLDADAVPDELSQSALRTMVKSYGQMPLQLMQSPHQPHAGGIRRPDVKNVPGPIPTVIGLRWGDFVGSPDVDSSQLQVVLSVQTSPLVANLISLPDSSVVGVPRSTITVSTKLPPLPESSSRRPIDCLSLLSFSFPDRLIRLRSMRPQLRPWTNVMQLDKEEVQSMVFSSSSSTLFVALTHGVIRTYSLVIDLTGVSRMSVSASLLAHSSPVSTLALCDEYGILVSGCSQGKVVVWDLNRLEFVRTVIPSGPAVTSLVVSKVSADIAVVTQATSGYGSRVDLFTVNGDHVGAVDTESTVTCLAMTDLPEGTAINCLAMGMQNGRIRIVDMWCMNVVREIYHTNYTQAVISICFSSHARKLLAALSSGRVLCWQNVSGLARSKSSPFQMIDPFV